MSSSPGFIYKPLVVSNLSYDRGNWGLITETLCRIKAFVCVVVPGKEPGLCLSSVKLFQEIRTVNYASFIMQWRWKHFKKWIFKNETEVLPLNKTISQLKITINKQAIESMTNKKCAAFIIRNSWGSSNEDRRRLTITTTPFNDVENNWHKTRKKVNIWAYAKFSVTICTK